MAAQALVKHAKEEIDWLGLYHLERAFREMFCLPGSHMTRSNDFSDRASYILEKVIPEAVSHVRDNSGAAPLRAKRFIFEKLKFNDNSNNEVSLFDPSSKPLLTLCHSIRTAFISLPS
jgi:transcription initiation factor TFIID subunit 2